MTKYHHRFIENLMENKQTNKQSYQSKRYGHLSTQSENNKQTAWKMSNKINVREEFIKMANIKKTIQYKTLSSQIDKKNLLKTLLKPNKVK